MIVTETREMMLDYFRLLGLIEQGEVPPSLLPSSSGLLVAGRKLFGREDSFHVEARVLFNGELGLYTTKGYSAVLIKRPGLQHKVYENIGTATLDTGLARYNWGQAHHGVPSLGNEAVNIYNDVLRLSRMEDEGAKQMAASLMLRYWSMTPLEHHAKGLIDPIPYRREMFFDFEGPEKDLIVRQAYNLLCGRAVARVKNPTPDGSVGIGWVTLDGNKQVEWPDFELGQSLRRIPFDPPLAASDADTEQMISGLLMGEKVTAGIRYRGKHTSVKIEVNPEEKSLSVFGEDGRRLILPAHHQKYDPMRKKGPNKGKGPGL